MRRGLLFVLAAAVSSCLLPAAASAGTLDQQQLLDTAPGPQVMNQGASVAQTFTAGITGRVDQVDLELTWITGQPTQPLTVEIRDAVGSLPGSTVLAGTNVAGPAPDPADHTFVPVTFAAPAPVTAGVKYAIVAYSTTPATNRWAWWGVITGDPYALGGVYFAASTPPTTTWDSNPFPNGDQAFKTYVAPPLPPVTTPGPTPGPTGQRAAALKKCKKKHSKKKRKKCRKKASKLPV
jgi:hypothetical protein